MVQGCARKDFWRDAKNQRVFTEWAGTQLAVHKPEDWYKITVGEFINIGGGGLLNNHHHGSLASLLQKVFPEVNWQRWKFTQVAKRFWEDTRNRKNFIDDVAHKLGVKTLNDWYKVTGEQVTTEAGSGLLQTHYGFSLIAMLKD